VRTGDGNHGKLMQSTNKENKAQHSVEQLTGGVRDLCSVLDQAAISFFWEWVLSPKIEAAGIPRNLTFEAVRNATIECSLISIRTLDEFFFGGGRPSDIRAHHYPRYCSPGPFLSQQERELINRRVAHLTIDRSENPQTRWQITELVRRAYERAGHFLTFILSDNGSSFRPENLDIESRLRTCSKIDHYMQSVLRRTMETSTTTCEPDTH
jgi:hypothetical protein